MTIGKSVSPRSHRRILQSMNGEIELAMTLAIPWPAAAGFAVTQSLSLAYLRC